LLERLAGNGGDDEDNDERFEVGAFALAVGDLGGDGDRAVIAGAAAGVAAVTAAAGAVDDDALVIVADSGACESVLLLVLTPVGLAGRSADAATNADAG